MVTLIYIDGVVKIGLRSQKQVLEDILKIISKKLWSVFNWTKACFELTLCHLCWQELLTLECLAVSPQSDLDWEMQQNAGKMDYHDICLDISYVFSVETVCATW